MSIEKLSIGLFSSTEKDFQKEFSRRMNPIEYAAAMKDFKALQDHLSSFMHKLKPAISDTTHPILVELVDEMDKYLEEII